MHEFSSKVTSYHIAKACGVSQPTVSRILGRHGDRYAPETRNKVLATAQKLGYRLNTAAQSIRSGAFGTVSLLLSTENGRSSLPPWMLRGMQDELMRRDMRLHVSMLPDQDLIATWGVPNSLKQAHSDGLLINYTHQIPAQLMDVIHAHRVPSVWLNSRQGKNCVYPDDFGAGYQMTRALLERGHKRILYIDFSHHWPLHAEHYSAIDRHAGYEKAMREAGLRVQAIGKPQSNGTIRSADLFVQAMRSLDRPTAVVSYSATRAIDMHVPLIQMGLRVPQDVEFAAVHTLSEPMPGMPLHLLATPDQQLGAAAVRMLLRRIETPDQDQPAEAVRFGR